MAFPRFQDFTERERDLMRMALRRFADDLENESIDALNYAAEDSDPSADMAFEVLLLHFEVTSPYND